MCIDDPDLDEKEYLESHIKQAEEAPGLNVHFTDPTEFNLAGEAGMSTEYSFEGAGIVCCCRVICIGSKGYVFTITSYSLEAYEAAVELLNNAIVWH